MNPAIQTDYGATSSSSIPVNGNRSQRNPLFPRPDALALPDILDTTARFLLERVYGSYSLTVTEGTMEAARRLALAVFASHIQPTPIRFTVSRPDSLPAARMLWMAFLLSDDAVLSFGDGVPMAFSTPGQDLRIWRQKEQQRVSRGRDDIGYMIHRIRQIASACAPCDCASGLLERLGDDAGYLWRQSAATLCAILARGGVR